MIEAIEEFGNVSAFGLIIFLLVLYFLQIIWTLIQGIQDETRKRKDGRVFKFNLFNCLWKYDDGYRSIWVFFVLTVLLPVFLNSMSDLISILNNKDYIEESKSLSRLEELMGDSQFMSISQFAPILPESEDPTTLMHAIRLMEIGFQQREKQLETWLNSAKIRHNQYSDMLVGKWMYYVCLACIGVLITLEFSYLHALRRNAHDWVPMLLSALVLDLITMLVLIFVVGNPVDWQLGHPDGRTVWAFLIATVVALLSSLLILVLARAKGALRDGQIDLSDFEVIAE